MKLKQTLENLLCTNKSMAFLIGSGISLPPPSNLMSGWETTHEIINRIAPEEDREQLLELCDSERENRKNKGDFLRYEGLMQIIQDNVDSNLNILDYLTIRNEPNENHHVLAQLLNQGHKIFTVNYDILIEKALEQQGINYTSLIYEEELNLNNLIQINIKILYLNYMVLLKDLKMKSGLIQKILLRQLCKQ
jgi:hypothetical protein